MTRGINSLAAMAMLSSMIGDMGSPIALSDADRAGRPIRRVGPPKALPPPDPGTMTRQRRRKAARQGKPVS